MSIESVMVSNHLILCCPLLLLPSIFPSIWVFSNESALCISWPSASASVFPMNSQDWFPLGLTGLISMLSRYSQESSQTQFKSIISSVLSLIYGPTFTSVHDYWKNHSFDYMDICQQSDVSAFSILSRFFIAFLPRSMHLLISWLQQQSTVILEPKKRKSVTTSTFPPCLPWSDGIGYHDLSFLNVEFQGSFSVSSFTFIKRLFSSLHLLSLEWYHLHIWGCQYFSWQSWF